jgi:inner membrane transporter RhtA
VAVVASRPTVRSGFGLAVTAMLSIQGGNVLITHVFDRIGAPGAAAERVTFGALALVLATRPSVRALRSDDWRLLARLGLVLAGTTLCFMESISRLPLGAAVTIAFLGPLGVSVRQARRRADLVWPALGLVGVSLVVGISGDGGDALGYVFAVTNACLWGAYVVFAGAAGERFPGPFGLTIAACMASVLLLPVGIATAGAELVDPGVLAIGASAGVITIALAFSLEYEALRRLSSRVFGTVVSLEPAVGATFGWVFLNQDMGLQQLIGIAVVVIASVGVATTAGAPIGDVLAPQTSER